jgi:alanyl-tRNA synthetase
LVDATIEKMGVAYPNLVKERDLIVEVLEREETGFARTLKTGLSLLEEAQRDVVSSGATVFPGDVAFKLHDTHGFPIELTEEIVSESGLSVDRGAFDAAMTEQRERARSKAKTLNLADDAQYRDLIESHGTTEFVGRDVSRYSIETEVLASLVGQGRRGRTLPRFDAPFYAESGGQVADTGMIVTETGSFKVLDVQNVAGGLFAHRGLLTGELLPGQVAVATIDPERREATRRNHTATHLLHAGLRTVLGDHVRQQGSFVGPDRLRFDFSHGAGVTPRETAEILTLVNTDVVANEEVNTIQTTKKDAETMGAIAFFGDKYGDRVRVVRAGAHSLEFCGGTHVDRLGDIGQIQIVSESSIGSNTRRIEGVSAMGAYQRSHDMETALGSVASILKVLSRGRRAGVGTHHGTTARLREGTVVASSAHSSRVSPRSCTRRSLPTCWSRGSTAIPVSSCEHSRRTFNAADAASSCWWGDGRQGVHRRGERRLPRCLERSSSWRHWWAVGAVAPHAWRSPVGAVPMASTPFSRGGGAVVLDDTSPRH